VPHAVQQDGAVARALPGDAVERAGHRRAHRLRARRGEAGQAEVQELRGGDGPDAGGREAPRRRESGGRPLQGEVRRGWPPDGRRRGPAVRL